MLITEIFFDEDYSNSSGVPSLFMIRILFTELPVLHTLFCPFTFEGESIFIYSFHSFINIFTIFCVPTTNITLSAPYAYAGS